MMTIPAAAELATRLVVATLVGAGVGLDREIRHKPAGLKTHALVALGAALITSIGAELTDLKIDNTALSRVIQGIIAGVGFLGGGAILKGEKDGVIGLTTAASIWVVASLGIACGGGHYAAALIAAVITLIVLIFGTAIENFFEGKRQRDIRPSSTIRQ